MALRLLSMPIAPALIQPFMEIGTRIGTRLVARNLFDDDHRRWLSHLNGTTGTARAFTRTVRDVIDRSGQRVHFLDHAYEISQLPPIGLFWGDLDPVIPLRHGKAAFRLLEGSSLCRFERCGHFPQLENPESFAEALSTFLDTADLPNARLRTDARKLRARGWLTHAAARQARTLRTSLRALAKRVQKEAPAPNHNPGLTSPIPVGTTPPAARWYRVDEPQLTPSVGVTDKPLQRAG